mmetsp:Transcript_10595/g.36985  ORF Transcript_10595/g.36985 Transcript_10595/m.36985 type:complete len:296 (-) Transcript_10595:1586-2473(-)
MASTDEDVKAADRGDDADAISERRRARRERRGAGGDDDDDSSSRRRRGRRDDDDEGEGDRRERRAIERSTSRPRDVSRSRSRARDDGGREGGAADRILRDPTLQAAMADNLKRKALKEAESRPEVHVIGEIVGATDFGTGVSCKWALVAGEKWEVLNGEAAGQTHTDYAMGDMAVWAHPLDVHYVTGTVHGWPRLTVQVWKLDEYGRNEIQAYGFVHMPASAGSFDLEVSTWRPLGSHGVEVGAFFLGSKPQLASSAMVCADVSDRYRLTTESAGTVHVHVDMVFKNLDAHKVEW